MPHIHSRKYEPTYGMSKRYLDIIRQLPCCHCGKKPCGTAHHLKSIPGSRGGAQKAPDCYAVPLCWDSHLNIIEPAGTRNEREIFRSWGIKDVVQLADQMWAEAAEFDSDAQAVRRLSTIVNGYRMGIESYV